MDRVDRDTIISSIARLDATVKQSMEIAARDRQEIREDAARDRNEMKDQLMVIATTCRDSTHVLTNRLDEHQVILNRADGAISTLKKMGAVFLGVWGTLESFFHGLFHYLFKH